MTVDQSADFNQDDFEAIELAAKSGKPWILIKNKIDIKNIKNIKILADGKRESDFDDLIGGKARNVINLSAKTGEGLEDLETAIEKLFPADKTDRPGTFLTDARQEDAARRAADALTRANDALEAGLTPDTALTDIEYALDALGELTGKTAKEEIVSRIFARFCVGK